MKNDKARMSSVKASRRNEQARWQGHQATKPDPRLRTPKLTMEWGGSAVDWGTMGKDYQAEQQRIQEQLREQQRLQAAERQRLEDEQRRIHEEALERERQVERLAQEERDLAMSELRSL